MLDSCSQRIVILFFLSVYQIGGENQQEENLAQYLERIPLRFQPLLNLPDMIWAARF